MDSSVIYAKKIQDWYVPLSFRHAFCKRCCVYFLFKFRSTLSFIVRPRCLTLKESIPHLMFFPFFVILESNKVFSGYRGCQITSPAVSGSFLGHVPPVYEIPFHENFSWTRQTAGGRSILTSAVK